MIYLKKFILTDALQISKDLLILTILMIHINKKKPLYQTHYFKFGKINSKFRN